MPAHERDRQRRDHREREDEADSPRDAPAEGEALEELVRTRHPEDLSSFRGSRQRGPDRVRSCPWDSRASLRLTPPGTATSSGRCSSTSSSMRWRCSAWRPCCSRRCPAGRRPTTSIASRPSSPIRGSSGSGGCRGSCAPSPICSSRSRWCGCRWLPRLPAIFVLVLTDGRGDPRSVRAGGMDHARGRARAHRQRGVPGARARDLPADRGARRAPLHVRGARLDVVLRARRNVVAHAHAALDPALGHDGGRGRGAAPSARLPAEPRLRVGRERPRVHAAAGVARARHRGGAEARAPRRAARSPRDAGAIRTRASSGACSTRSRTAACSARCSSRCPRPRCGATSPTSST